MIRFQYLPLFLFIGVIAYSGSFGVPFLYDDLPNLADNPSIRTLYPPWDSLTPPAGSGLLRRPLANFSFALCHAFFGWNLAGWHAINLLIHCLSALSLFGIVRRTLEKSPEHRQGGTKQRETLFLATVSSGIFLLHPLQTQAVTYLVQRCESMAGLFQLLCLYCFIRAGESRRSTLWQLLSVFSLFLGTGVKETVVILPFLIPIYDWAFDGRGLLKSFRRWLWLYMGYAGCIAWLLLLQTGRGMVMAHKGSPEFTGLEYAISQPKVVLRYFRLFIFPRPLCFHYGWRAVSPGEALGYGSFFLGLIFLFVRIAGKRRSLFFLLAACLLPLLPSSSFVPLNNLAFEYRMYFTVAPLSLLLAGGLLYAGTSIGRFTEDGRQRSVRIIRWMLASIILLSFGVLTWDRNRDYRTGLDLWRDTVEKCPENPVALNNLGLALANRGRLREAAGEFRQALSLEEDDVVCRTNLADTLLSLKNFDEAQKELAVVLESNPDYAPAQFSLGRLGLKTGDHESARNHLLRAIALRPTFAEAHYNLGILLFLEGDKKAALRHFYWASKIRPGYARALFGMARTLASLGRIEEAIGVVEEGLRFAPNDPQALYFLKQWKKSGG